MLDAVVSLKQRIDSNNLHVRHGKVSNEDEIYNDKRHGKILMTCH